MSDDDKKKITPKVQFASDKFMELYYIGLEFAKCALETRNAIIEVFDEELPTNKKLMVMDFGAIGEELMKFAATADAVKRVHGVARGVGRRADIDMPFASSYYDDEYLDLINQSVSARLGPKVARR